MLLYISCGNIVMLTFGPIAQLDRALDYESRCREFESLLGHQAKSSDEKSSLLFFVAVKKDRFEN